MSYSIPFNDINYEINMIIDNNLNFYMIFILEILHLR